MARLDAREATAFAPSLNSGYIDLVAELQAAAVLQAVEHQLRSARAVLAAGEDLHATTAAYRLLRSVEDLLAEFPDAATGGSESWRQANLLRDELGGYLLAAATLEETGVSLQVVASMLQRGAACAQELLERLDRIS